jgi:CcmD family protein
MENGKLKMVWSLLTMLVLPMVTFAQGVDMADTMRSEGKIYVVVGVIAIIFIGIAIYLISLDRRISKMENQKGKN